MSAVGFVLSYNIIVVSADVFEKFLEQEEARLLEQAQLDEDNEGSLVSFEEMSSGRLTLCPHGIPHDCLRGSVSLKFDRPNPMAQESLSMDDDLQSPRQDHNAWYSSDPSKARQE